MRRVIIFDAGDAAVSVGQVMPENWAFDYNGEVEARREGGEVRLDGKPLLCCRWIPVEETEFHEKQIVHTVADKETGEIIKEKPIVWVRRDGVSFLACDKLRWCYTEEHYWAKPGTFDAYTNGEPVTTCRMTGEILDAKRIKSRLIPGADFYATMWEFEKEIDTLMAISEQLYGTSDLDSPLWSAIESALDRQAALALHYQYKHEDYVRVFHNTEYRAMMGLRPVKKV